jgi:probable phosphoglycerate mutase
MTRLLLVRHGQSTWNAAGRWQGQADPPLSELGQRQASEAATRLGTVDAIVASDLDRAVHTATILAAGLGVGPVVIEPRLRETDAGSWSGLTRAQIDEQWPGFVENRQRPDDFEPEADLRARVLAAIDDIAATYADGEVVVVTHGGVIYAVERHLGAEFHRIPNLGARWLEHHGTTSSGEASLTLGDRLDLADPADTTTPNQL